MPYLAYFESSFERVIILSTSLPIGTIQGVVMDNPNEFAYNKSDIYLIDDWR
jgi:hypothetical protein